MNVKRAFPWAIAASLALVAAGCGTSPISQNRIGANIQLSAKAVPGQVLVKFRPGVSFSTMQAKASKFGLRFMSTQGSLLPKLGWHMAAYNAQSTNMVSLLSSLSSDPAVAYAEPNFVASVNPVQAVMPRDNDDPALKYDDPMANEQYALNKMETAKAHSITLGSPKTILAIVDTGVDYNHPDFMDANGKSRVIKGKSFADNSDPVDRYGHGTHCAGIAAASINNGEGIVGQAPGVTILNAKVLGDNGSGSYAGVADGIIYTADQGAKVISMSLGGPSNSQVITDAVNYALGKDALIVAAMGNDYGPYKSYPAAIDGVMAIGSTNVRDERSRFSNYGDWISASAPGEGILSTLPTIDNVIGKKNYGVLSGTSMATPAAAGIAALVRDLHPDWDYQTVRAKLEQTSDEHGETGFDKYFGHGRVNAFKAVRN